MFTSPKATVPCPLVSGAVGVGNGEGVVALGGFGSGLCGGRDGRLRQHRAAPVPAQPHPGRERESALRWMP